MDAALYEKLLEELRSDLSATAPALAELQSVESFLKGRLENADDKDSYQKVLDDIAADINSRHQAVAELQRIDRYVAGKLGKDVFNLKLAPAPETAKPAQAPVAAKSAPEKADKQAPPKKAIPVKTDDDTKDEPPKKDLAEMAGAAGGNTIEFGPDGFPIASAATPAKKAPAGIDQTINFGPDGFPVDFPKPKN